MQEFSQRVCQYVEAFENEQKKKYKMSLQKTEASAGTAHIFFLKRVNFNLCFACLKWQLLFHCFHFFSSKFFFICTIPRFAHSLFNVGLLLSSLGSSEGAPPPLRSCFWLFIRISSRVESSRAAAGSRLKFAIGRAPWELAVPIALAVPLSGNPWCTASFSEPTMTASPSGSPSEVRALFRRR